MLPSRTQPATQPQAEAGTRLWCFGAFVLREDLRRLEREGRPVALGSRAAGLLLALVKRAGEVVGKEELLAAVWPDVVVDEASVRVHMSLLRKALGTPGPDDGCLEWISNIPLRGYCFLGRVRREFARDAAFARAADMPEAQALGELPLRTSTLFGRGAELERLLAMLEASRLVTVVGAGGVGKTRLAVRVAEIRRARALPEGGAVRFVDLAPLTSQDHVLTTIARAVGVRGGEADVAQAVIERLAREPALLLVDNCEHVIETLAPLLHRFLAALPALRVLATSRDVLRVEGEHVLRLLPLPVHRDPGASLAQALHSPAVQLLVDRAGAAGAAAFDDASGGALLRICRQVDGIPLAIELVAARLGVQAANDLAFGLDDHMRLHSTVERVTLARQRTLAATLDWSIGLLDEAELLLFRRLSVFRAHFDMEAALGVAVDALDPDRASDVLVSLARKSLVVYDAERESHSPYRLLDTTRSYARVLLARANEQETAARRHAQLMLERMCNAGTELAVLDAAAWTRRYGFLLDDVRAALDASLAQQEDTALAGALTIASATLWFRLSEVGEYRDRVRAALAYVQALRTPDRLAAGWLQLALYNALWHTGGTVAEMSAACEAALASALEFGVGTLEFQARWGLCALNITRGDYRAALRHAQVLGAFAAQSDSEATRNLSLRMQALASHFCGAFAEARAHAEAAMAVDGATRRSSGNTFQPDARITAMAILARTLWLQGDTAGALAAARACEQEAAALGHAMSSCVALFWICPVAIWAGEHALARRWVDAMRQETQARGFGYWHAWAEAYDDALALEASADRPAWLAAVAERMPGIDAPRAEMLVTFCAEWIDDRLLERAGQGDGPWCRAEIFRAAGWRHERQGDAARAEACYRQALELARAQGALAWERRAARSLEALRRP
ncbi:ATP-binding protein [Variovorax sp. DAIF25]|uniref:ATP-binding protein n=1 Tax=Variovorax sp. DAIF25 TaxID=3080983 RepID=UPI003D6A2398